MSDKLLSGKIAIVTGGGRGLGRAMALALADNGADVMVAAHIDSDFPEVEAAHGALDDPGRLLCMATDIRDGADCDGVVVATRDAFGDCNVLINNAGLTFTYIWPDRFRRDKLANFWEAEDEIIENVMAVNFVGADRMARRVAPAMVAAGWGRIINVTTMIETMRMQDSSPYGPSKAALEMATCTWAQQLEGTGVTANILNPGAGADTPGMADEVRRGEVPEIVLIAADQMAAPAVWLASDATDAINGMRYDAAPWDRTKSPAEEGARIGRPAGFELMAR